MTDLEISKALAIAIGWTPSKMNSDTKSLWILESGRLRKFDYRDPMIIWPIAERYNAFPRRTSESWMALHRKLSPGVSHPYYAYTPEKAVALAVIAAKK